MSLDHQVNDLLTTHAKELGINVSTCGAKDLRKLQLTIVSARIKARASHGAQYPDDAVYEAAINEVLKAI